MLEFTNASPPITILPSAITAVCGPCGPNDASIYVTAGHETHLIVFATHDEARFAYQHCRNAISAGSFRQSARDELTRLEVAHRQGVFP